MRFPYLLVLLSGFFVRGENVNSNELLDFSNGEDNAFLWRNLFIKLNAVLRDTESLSQNLLDVNKRLDDLAKRQELQDNRISQLMENVQDMRANNRKECSTSTWTSVLRRQDDTVNFYRNWNEYREGFGDPNGNFFIGLQWLHNVTNTGTPQELLIILKDFNNQLRYAKYDNFRIGSEEEKFNLQSLGQYSGDAGDALINHLGHKFTTLDQDNDNNNERNCAVTFQGAWWFFGPCYSGHLNGPYRNEKAQSQSGISWNPFRGWDVSLKYAEMMIRPRLT